MGAAEFAALLRRSSSGAAMAATATDAENHRDGEDYAQKQARQEADDDCEDRKFIRLSLFRGCSWH